MALKTIPQINDFLTAYQWLTYIQGRLIHKSMRCTCMWIYVRGRMPE